MTTSKDPAMDEAERIVEGYNQGRIALSSLNYQIYQRPAPQLPWEVEAAFQHAAEAWRIWAVAESPEGGRDVEEDPQTHAERCRVLLDEALAELVTAVDTYRTVRVAVAS